MANPWFKFYGTEYLSDTKFNALDGNARSCWITLLSYACAEGGFVKYLDEDKLLIMAGVPLGGEEWRKTKGILDRFEEKEMIHREGDVIFITNWEKRQTLTPYERVKRHRQKMNDDNADDNVMITAEKNRQEKNRQDMFARMWEVYPKKVGKRDAFKAFEKLNPTEEITQNIISAIESLKLTPQWQDNDGRYIPHPATFLNRESFDDAPKKKAEPIRWERTEKGMKPIFETSEYAKSINKRI